MKEIHADWCSAVCMAGRCLNYQRLESVRRHAEKIAISEWKRCRDRGWTTDHCNAPNDDIYWVDDDWWTVAEEQPVPVPLDGTDC